MKRILFLSLAYALPIYASEVAHTRAKLQTDDLYQLALTAFEKHDDDTIQKLKEDLDLTQFDTQKNSNFIFSAVKNGYHPLINSLIIKNKNILSQRPWRF